MIRYVVLSFVIHLGLLIPFEINKESFNDFTLSYASNVVEMSFSSSQHSMGRSSTEQPVSAADYQQKGVSELSKIVKEFTVPEYPLIAIKKNWTGDVVVRIFIQRQGTIERLEVIKSSGHNQLDESALKAVRTWAFEQSEQNMVVDYPIKFVLDDSFSIGVSSLGP